LRAAAHGEGTCKQYITERPIRCLLKEDTLAHIRTRLAKLSYCIGPRVGCIQHSYPYVNKTQYGNGSKRASGGY